MLSVTSHMVCIQYTLESELKNGHESELHDDHTSTLITLKHKLATMQNEKHTLMGFMTFRKDCQISPISQFWTWKKNWSPKLAYGKKCTDITLLWFTVIMLPHQQPLPTTTHSWCSLPPSSTPKGPKQHPNMLSGPLRYVFIYLFIFLYLL